MKIRIINIGNSRGILLSKSILEKYGFKDAVEMEMRKDHLELRAIGGVREGWEEAFQSMYDKGDDRLLLEDSLDEEHLEEWEEE